MELREEVLILKQVKRTGDPLVNPSDVVKPLPTNARLVKQDSVGKKFTCNIFILCEK